MVNKTKLVDGIHSGRIKLISTSEGFYIFSIERRRFLKINKDAAILINKILSGESNKKNFPLSKTFVLNIEKNI